jgi:hypothetical protein
LTSTKCLPARRKSSSARRISRLSSLRRSSLLSSGAHRHRLQSTAPHVCRPSSDHPRSRMCMRMVACVCACDSTLLTASDETLCTHPVPRLQPQDRRHNLLSTRRPSRLTVKPRRRPRIYHVSAYWPCSCQTRCLVSDVKIMHACCCRSRVACETHPSPETLHAALQLCSCRTDKALLSPVSARHPGVPWAWPLPPTFSGGVECVYLHY